MCLVRGDEPGGRSPVGDDRPRDDAGSRAMGRHRGELSDDPTILYDQYQLGHLRRLDVLPGVTGLWQISARRDPSFETNVLLDLEYIETWNIWLDMKILLATIPKVLGGSGY